MAVTRRLAVQPDAGLGLAEVFPVWHRLGTILAGQWSACEGDQGWCRLTEGHENSVDGSSLGEEGSGLLGVPSV
jgi:hypothetical protein